MIFVVIFCRCSSDDSSTAEADEVPLIMSEQTGFDVDENEYLMRSRNARRRRKSVMYYLCDAWIEACSRSVGLVFTLTSFMLAQCPVVETYVPVEL